MGLLDFLFKSSKVSSEEAAERRRRLLEWQNLVSDEEYPELILSEKQLKEISKSQVENDLRILGDCARIAQSTVDPEVFFMRLQLFIDKLERLSKFEKFVPFSDMLPSEALKQAESDKQETIHDFLKRYYAKTFELAESMKTEKGKQSKYDKFYSSLQKFYPLMDKNNISYIESKYFSNK